jgi:hypothetical protein
MEPSSTSAGSAAIERDEDVERLVRARRRASGYRTAARRALRLARRYRAEEGAPGGARERACVAQALAWRVSAREALHASTSSEASSPSSVRPGLARGRVGSAEEVAPATPRRGVR